MASIPEEEWIHCQVIAPVGDEAGVWSFEVKLPDGTVHRFEDLKNMSADWKDLEWLGFVSQANEEVRVWMDDLELEWLETE